MRWVPILVILFLVFIAGCLTIRIKDTNKRLFTWIILAYFACLGMILFTPISFDGAAIYIMPAGVGRVNLSRLYLHGLGFLENIILTIPLGIIIKKLIPQMPMIVVGILGVVIGALIESLQYYMSQHWLINRSSDINDVIANAMGIFIGGLVIVLYKYLQTEKQTN